MNRNEFIKTLVLGTGVLSAGVSLAEPKPQAISLKTLINDYSTTIELFNNQNKKSISIRMWGIDGDNPQFRNIQEVNNNPNLNVHYFDPKTFGDDANKHYLQVNFETYDSYTETLSGMLLENEYGLKSNVLYHNLYTMGNTIHCRVSLFDNYHYVHYKVDSEGLYHTSMYHTTMFQHGEKPTWIKYYLK